MPKQDNEFTKEDEKKIEEVCERYSHANSLMIYLQQIQAEFRYVPPYAIGYLSEKTNISESHIYGVLTFYSQFSLIPVGENMVKVCHGTACHVGGAKVLGKKLKAHLKLDEETETTEDHLFTVQDVACLGCCALAPAVMVNDKVYGKLDADRAKAIIDTYRKTAEDAG